MVACLYELGEEESIHMTESPGDKQDLCNLSIDVVLQKSLRRRRTCAPQFTERWAFIFYDSRIYLAYAKSLQKLGITHPIAAPPKLYVKYIVFHANTCVYYLLISSKM